MGSTRYEFPWPPSANQARGARGYWIHVGGRKVLTPFARLYRSEVASIVRKAKRGHNPEGTLTLRISLHPPDRRGRDSDNVMKVLKDALVAANPKHGERVLEIVALKDDSNKYIRREWIEWLEVEKDGRVEIELTDFAPAVRALAGRG